MYKAKTENAASNRFCLRPDPAKAGAQGLAVHPTDPRRNRRANRLLPNQLRRGKKNQNKARRSINQCQSF
jgi:hypothetical protein